MPEVKQGSLGGRLETVSTPSSRGLGQVGRGLGPRDLSPGPRGCGAHLAGIHLPVQVAGTQHPVGERVAVQAGTQALVQQLHCGFLQRFWLDHCPGQRDTIRMSASGPRAATPRPEAAGRLCPGPRLPQREGDPRQQPAGKPAEHTLHNCPRQPPWPRRRRGIKVNTQDWAPSSPPS